MLTESESAIAREVLIRGPISRSALSVRLGLSAPTLTRLTKPFLERGILVVGSGNIVHNLAGMDPGRPDGGFDWAHRFDDAARELMIGAPDEIPRLRDARDFDVAVPTPDHFIPLLYLAGLAGAADRPTDVLVDGYSYGSLSMTSYTLDVPVSRPAAAGAGSPPAPRRPGPSSLM